MAPLCVEHGINIVINLLISVAGIFTWWNCTGIHKFMLIIAIIKFVIHVGEALVQWYIKKYRDQSNCKGYWSVEDATKSYRCGVLATIIHVILLGIRDVPVHLMNYIDSFSSGCIHNEYVFCIIVTTWDIIMILLRVAMHYTLTKEKYWQKEKKMCQNATNAWKHN